MKIDRNNSFLGEEKPQSFIPLDIDKQADGKLIIGNHINFSPPNGRLPMPVPLHLAPQQPPGFVPDGGVYQGQPLITQSNDWNPNTKVKDLLGNLFYFIEI